MDPLNRILQLKVLYSKHIPIKHFQADIIKKYFNFNYLNLALHHTLCTHTALKHPKQLSHNAQTCVQAVTAEDRWTGCTSWPVRHTLLARVCVYTL